MRGQDVCGKQLTVVANYYGKQVSATDFDSNWCTVNGTYLKPWDTIKSKFAIVYFIKIPLKRTYILYIYI